MPSAPDCRSGSVKRKLSFHMGLCAAAAVCLSVAAAAQARVNDYATLAASCATPVFDSHAAARAGYKDGEVLRRMEVARQRLRALRPSDSDLKSARDTLLARIETCDSTLDGIRQLDSTVPNWEAIFRKVPGGLAGIDALTSEKKDFKNLAAGDQVAFGELAVAATFEIGGTIINKIRAHNRWADYRSQYESVRKASLALADCARSRCGPARNAPIGIDIDGNFDSAFINDSAEFTNLTGTALTNCTLLVTLRMPSDQTGYDYVERHVHFVDNWARGETLYAIYYGPEAGGIARDESLSRIHAVTVEVMADQLRSSTDYRYFGTAEYTEDVERYCKDLRFTGAFHSESPGLFSHDGFGHLDARVKITFTGGRSVIYPSRITVAVRGDFSSETFWWEGSEWSSSGLFTTKTFSASEFNKYGNPSFEMTLSFPGTDYRHTVSWRAK